MASNRRITRTSTIQNASNVFNNVVVDSKLRDRYGTSVDEFMSKEYQLHIQNRIRTLRSMFQKINKDKNSFISVDELTDYFNQTKQETDGEAPFTRDYFERIFKILDKNKDSELVLEEFINGYIRLEETIKAKRNKFQKVLEEFEDNTKKYNDNLNRHLNEYPIGNDLTNESTLYVSVYEAKDLDGGIITSCNPFITLTFEGKTVQTNLKKNTSKPTWNEEFKFNVTNPDSELIIEVYNQVMIGSTKLGMRKFPLRDFLTQEKQISWYELQDTNNNNLPGQLNLKLQFIKSFNKYYKDRIANTERNYSIISKTHQKLERYCDEIENRPFGAIYLGEVDKLLDSDEMKNCEAIIREIDKQRQLLYVIHPNEDSMGGILKAIPKKIISWGKSTKVLMMLYLICAIVALFARSDFVNFFISIATWVLLIYDKKFSAQKYFQNLIIVIGVSLGYDLIWVFMKWNEFWKGKNGDIEIGLKKAVYIISIIEMVVKGFLIPKLLAVKKKKETQ